ncbi:uncharacterized protein LOC111593216 isoform X2 [Drosophila hydei]|nr:uncharacterized protein LOC111593216 isoform X2 [Drosophila hydei]
MGSSYEFSTLYVILSWVEGVCLFVLIVDLCWVCCHMGTLLLASISVAYSLGVFLLFAGSYSVIMYTDVYVVVRSFHTDNLWSYEIVYHCCGINGPSDYGNVSQKDTVPVSCYKDQEEKLENLYKRGCIFATDDSWFWFVFSNCYWFAFVLFCANLITHWKLRERLRSF